MKMSNLIWLLNTHEIICDTQLRHFLYHLKVLYRMDINNLNNLLALLIVLKQKF